MRNKRTEEKIYLPKSAQKKKIQIHKGISKQILAGIITGDVAGSRYENAKTEENYRSVDLLTAASHFSDDSVLSYAVYEATKEAIKEKKEEKIQAIYADAYIRWAKRYPDAGYGAGFREWVRINDKEAVSNGISCCTGIGKSCGDGSAMRAGVIGSMFEKAEDVIKYAKCSAIPTHNHPEGIKGAVAVAMCVWMVLAGYSKEGIKEYVCSLYPKAAEEQRYFNLVDPSLSIEELLIPHKYKTLDALCQTAVPLALINFINTDSYEECLRVCLQYPRDGDTVMAISGGIAAAYYQEATFQNQDVREIAKQFFLPYREQE